MSYVELCRVEGDELVIRVKVEALATAAEITLPELLEIDPRQKRPVKVTDQAGWAKEIADTLNTEVSEDGRTRITNMIDGAFKHALEYGAEGIEIEESREEICHD